MSSSTANETFTAMDKEDLDAIGTHCKFAYCHQLDFLPFRCNSCHQTYCLDHRTETAHQCARAGEWAKNRRLQNMGNASATTIPKPTLSNSQQCPEVSCKTFVNTSQNLGVHCQYCNRTYCLKHRFREDHDCKVSSPDSSKPVALSPEHILYLILFILALDVLRLILTVAQNLTPLGARPIDIAMQTNKDKLKLGFGRLKTWGKERQEALKPKPAPTSKAAQLAALNTLKKNAKGDDKLPAEKRVYLHVEAEAASTTSKLPRAELFFSTEWSVGRMLDEAAKKLQVANLNNRAETEEQRLRVYFVEGGRLLEFHERLGKALVSGNTVVLLRGVGPKEEK